jgi:alpha/beta superfamily hydrolase
MDIRQVWVGPRDFLHGVLRLSGHLRLRNIRLTRSGLLGLTVLGLSLGIAADPADIHSPDLAREQRMADEIVESILDGEPVALETAQGTQFLGIHMQSVDSPSKGTVIILHGRGFHPDWGDVVQPLRIGLTEAGWDTLSIQLPVLHKSARYFDYVEIFDAANPRIEATIAWATDRKTARVVMLAHSCGFHMAQHWVRARGQAALDQFDAFIGIGMGATDYGQPMREPFVLDRISVPVLDIYAENDFPAVRRLAPERLRALERGGNNLSAQLVVADSDHYFRDRGESLLKVVADWLDTL